MDEFHLPQQPTAGFLRTATGAVRVADAAAPTAAQVLTVGTDTTTASWATPSTYYDAVVATSGGDYTTITAAMNAGKRTIFVKAGTIVDNFTGMGNNLNDVTIHGAGRGQTIIRPNSNVNLSSTTNAFLRCTWKDLTFDVGSNTFGMDRDKNAGHTWINCRLNSTANSPMGFNATNGAYINCVFTSTNTTDNGKFTINGNGWMMDNCLFQVPLTLTSLTANASVYLASGGTGKNLISNTTFETQTSATGVGALVIVRDSLSTKFSNCSFYSTGTTGSLILNRQEYASFTGCSFEGAASHIRNVAGNYVAINGNSFKTAATSCIEDSIGTCTIMGNEFKQPSTAGIGVNSTHRCITNYSYR
jgi:hypothetical protein